MATILNRLGQQLQAFGFERLTVSTTSVGFTAGTIQPATRGYATRAVVTVETNPIRYRYDNVAPTATTGHLLNAGDTLILEGVNNIANVLFIRQGSADATIQCSYERIPQGL